MLHKIKSRILSAVLCVAMLLTSMPANIFAFEGEDVETPEYLVNPGSKIGNVATFNIDSWSNYHICDKPAEYDDAWWNDDNYWLYNEQVGTDELPDDNLQMVITNYFYDKERDYLWYFVEAAPGYELPEKLANKPYVLFQENLGYEDGLYIADSGKNFILDEEGNAIAEVSLPFCEKKILKSESSLQGKVSYQWQILLDGQWVDIQGENEAEIKSNIGMFVNILDEKLQANLRCVSNSGSKTVEGDAIPVTIVFPETAGTEGAVAAAYSLRSRSVSTGDGITLDEEGDQSGIMTVNESDISKVQVTVKFIYGSNNQAVSGDRIYDIPLGGSISDSFELPVMEGYNAYLEADTENIYTSYTLDMQNITEDMVLTFKYWPAKVNYTVIYFWQNTEDDGYTEHERYTTTGFTGNTAFVEDVEYDGFYQLLYEEVPIASDGSTVVEVYYDREYYKMLFDLDGGYGIQPVYARYGTEIDLPNPTKAGYSFVGWDDVTTGNGDGIQDILPETIPSYHSEYKAIWEADENAKVTVVYWGENANDEEYSYIDSQELYVKPGTELTFGKNQQVCTLEPHTHGAGCSYQCGIEAHTHVEDCYTLSCQKEEHVCTDACYSCGHTHVLKCYQTRDWYTLKESSPEQTITVNGDGVYEYTTGSGYWKETHYYLFLNGKWYCYYGNYSGNKSDTQSISECTHTHDSSCTKKCEGEHSHLLENGCYTLSCPLKEHIHDATCYSCIAHTHTDACYLRASNKLNEALYTYVKSDTVTVAADGSTVMNVYYDRTTFTLTFNADGKTVATITEKWGAKISGEFQKAPFNTTYNGRAWKCTEENKYGYALQTLDIMPQFDATFNLYDKSSNTLKTIYYYVEKVGANVSNTTWPTSTANFEYLKEVDTYFNYATYEEEYHEMVGFVRYSANVSGFSNNDKDFSNNVLYLYYLRDSFELEFHNGEKIVKTESVEYEAPLDNYGFTPMPPTRYEPGSVQFAGWYLNPEGTGEEFILDEHIMPASNLILYAKWEPVTHTIRFYLDETIERTDDNVYTAVVDGETIPYKYGVPHGSRVQDPYTPPGDPQKGQYIFIGWFYTDAQGNEQMWDFENTTVTGDTDIYAKWSSNQLVQYEVRFVDGNGNDIADPIIGSALGGNSKTFEAKGNEQLYEDYQEEFFPTVQSHTIVMDLENPENNKFVFVYQKVDAVPYIVRYLDAETKEDVVGTDNVEVFPKTVNDNKKAVVTETYVQVPGYLPNTYQQTLIIVPGGKNEIIFYYTKDELNGMYVVHYMTQNLDGNTYTEHSVFEGRAEKGATITATEKTIENFTYNVGHTENITSGVISTKEVLQLYLYYDRNQYPYKVQYLEEATNKVLAPQKLVEGSYWEEYVTEEALKIDNYTLVSPSPVSIQIRKDTEDPTVNIITFYYTENKVNLHYKVAIGEGAILCKGEEGKDVSEEVKIKTGVAKGAQAKAAMGYKFAGWYRNKECTELLSEELQYVPTKEEDTLWEETTYYAKFVPAMADLTIERTDVSEDKNQVFVYKVQSEATDFVIYVTVEIGEDGSGSTTIHDLPFGEYIITQENDWSWRYSDGSAIVEHDDEDDKANSTVKFAETHDSEQWLNGHSSLFKNIFK